MLKRRLTARLGLFGALLALLLQAFVPTTHLSAMSLGPVLPFPDAVICGTHPDGDGAPQPMNHSSACLSCCIPHLPISAVPSAPALRLPHVSTIAAFPPFDLRSSFQDIHGRFQARAPPSLSS